MKKFILSLLALASCAMPARALGPFVGYVQISTGSGIKQTGGFNVQTATTTQLCFDDGSCQTKASSAGSGPTGQINASNQNQVPRYSTAGSSNVLTGASNLTNDGTTVTTNILNVTGSETIAGTFPLLSTQVLQAGATFFVSSGTINRLNIVQNSTTESALFIQAHSLSPIPMVIYATAPIGGLLYPVYAAIATDPKNLTNAPFFDVVMDTQNKRVSFNNGNPSDPTFGMKYRFAFNSQGSPNFIIDLDSAAVTLGPLTTLTVQSSTTFNGNVNFSSGVLVANNAGTSGQFLKSNGPNAAPNWSSGVSTTTSNLWTAQQTFTSSITAAGFSDTAHFSVRGTAPSLSSCGATPAVVGTDNGGQITLGTGSPTGCTVTFNAAWTASPFCVAQATSTVTTATVSSVSGSQFVITESGSVPSLTINYVCVGRD